MQAFINERSAHGQCHDRKEVTRLVAGFIKVLDRLASYQKRDQQWLGPELVLYQRSDIRAECVLLSGGNPGSLVSNISDVLVKTRLAEALSKLRPRSWTQASQQLEDVYYIYEGDLENGSSIAELAERVFQTPTLSCFLTNFGDCRFPASKRIGVERESQGNATTVIELGTIEDVEGLEDWAASAGYIPGLYPLSSRHPPRDDQTILTDRQRFERTNYVQNGRAVFREVATGRLWCVDSGHSGRSAELEVFDANRKHVGTSDLRGSLDQSQRVAGRRLSKH